MMAEPLKVLFLSPEVVPYAKTGGLADVAGALPAALKRLGVDVRICLPHYRMVRNGGFASRPLLKALEAPVGDDVLPACVLGLQTEDGVPVYMIDREDMYDRPSLYGNASGDYYDNIERFSFFAHASLRLAEALAFRPHVIHCHDWQTGLVPALLRGPYQRSPMLHDVPAVFTVHNLGYQGLFPVEKLPVTGLAPEEFFHPEGLEYWGKISLLKAGVVYADAITTVSPTYAKEIQTPEFGLGMEGILSHRRSRLHGILNGVDYRVWDPATDKHLPENYFPGKMAGKERCKAALIQELGLDSSLENGLLLGMTTRLTAQKGLDLMEPILDDLLALNVGLVVLGAGEDRYQSALQDAATRNPGKVGLRIGFDEPLAHRIMAGVDVFLIPSRYEPCGLTQMYGLKYGTVPLVRATGGLEDTIVNYDPRTGLGNGFKFGPYDPGTLLTTIRQAVGLYREPRQWRPLVINGMKADFSWDRSADAYVALYRSVLGG
jgi:starch synthase